MLREAEELRVDEDRPKRGTLVGVVPGGAESVAKVRDTPRVWPQTPTLTRHDHPMGAVQGRKNNPSGGGTHQIRVRVAEPQKNRLKQMADALGISEATLIDRMIARQEVDEHGRPTWWPHVQDELTEVPLKSA